MCNFLSGITFSDFLLPTRGRCHADPCKTNSHSELVRLLGLNDVKSEGHFAKWEFVPSGDIADFDNYSFKLDEERVPDWWTPEIESETIEYAKSVLRRVVLTSGLIEELRNDVYALAGNVAVKKLYSRVGAMRESSQATVYTETAHVTLGENCNAVVIDRSAGSVKCHVSGKRKKVIGSPRGN